MDPQTVSITSEPYSPRTPVRTQYLHISAYSCDRCRGPVISGSTAVRESEISKETEVKKVGAICLSCGNKQRKATAEHLVSAYFEEINREKLHGAVSCGLAAPRPPAV